MKYVHKLPASGLVQQVVRKVDSLAFIDEKKRRREEVVAGWWELLSFDMKCSAIGRKISVEASWQDLPAYAQIVLDATFSVKSANTLAKRLYALRTFREWCDDTGRELWLPVEERTAWEYGRWLQESQAAPTKASSFLESCRFAWYLLGVDGCDLIEKSLRIRGLTAQLHSRKRPWRPADTLTLVEVKQLHQLLGDETKSLADRVVAGHLLHLLYGRCRWSDLVHVQGWFVDDDGKYLELEARAHKGARNADVKSRLLPIVSPCHGVTTESWVEVYRQVRQECGLEEPDQSPIPMLPAPLDSDGNEWFSTLR